VRAGLEVGGLRDPLELPKTTQRRVGHEDFVDK
jgi:hypothetical protein